MEQNDKNLEELKPFQIKCKNYLIQIEKDPKKEKLIIYICLNSINNITHKKSFSFEDIENIDPTFFFPFKDNFILLYKYLIRLLKANLFNLEINKENKEIMSIQLFCQRKNKLRAVKIDIPSINFKEKDSRNNKINYFDKINENMIHFNSDTETEEINKSKDEKYNIGDAPAPKSNKKKNKAQYEIEIYKLTSLYEEKKEYKEIQINIREKTTNLNNKEPICYYAYLDSHEIFGQSIPYYNLFNFSIDDVYDDLKIIIYHQNYRFERGKNNIKLFFKVFNGQNEPYSEIFILALNKARTEQELLIEMKNYFESNENKIESEKKRIIREDIQNDEFRGKNKEENFLNNFLKLNENVKDEKGQNLENDKINPIKSEIISNKSELKNNNNQNNFNMNKNENKKNNTKTLLNHKRNNYYDNNLEMYYKKEVNVINQFKIEKIIQNSLKMEKDNSLNKSDSPESNKDKENKSPKKKKLKKIKKKDEKKKNNAKKSKKFKLDKNKRYNIDRDSIISQYTNIFYTHPLDNDDELEKIFNPLKQEFYLCNICKVFYKDRYEVRVHQWDEHLKPFDEIIQNRLRQLKNEKNKLNNNLKIN